MLLRQLSPPFARILVHRNGAINDICSTTQRVEHIQALVYARHHPLALAAAEEFDDFLHPLGRLWPFDFLQRADHLLHCPGDMIKGQGDAVEFRKELLAQTLAEFAPRKALAAHHFRQAVHIAADPLERRLHLRAVPFFGEYLHHAAAYGLQLVPRHQDSRNRCANPREPRRQAQPAQQAGFGDKAPQPARRFKQIHGHDGGGGAQMHHRPDNGPHRHHPYDKATPAQTAHHQILEGGHGVK